MSKQPATHPNASSSLDSLRRQVEDVRGKPFELDHWFNILDHAYGDPHKYLTDVLNRYKLNFEDVLIERIWEVLEHAAMVAARVETVLDRVGQLGDSDDDDLSTIMREATRWSSRLTGLIHALEIMTKFDEPQLRKWAARINISKDERMVVQHEFATQLSPQ